MFTRILAIPRTQAKDCFCHSHGAERCRELFRGAWRSGAFSPGTLRASHTDLLQTFPGHLTSSASPHDPARSLLKRPSAQC